MLFLLAVLWSGAQGQRLDPNDYIYPIRDVRKLYAANFGEIRTGHFHAGVDIKTDGVEGKQLVAAADGYIARAVITPGGYGRVVYLVTDKGTTVVYGHLQRFSEEIETSLRNERYGRKSNSADLSFDPGMWPVKQGECVGWSGNSGRSAGPHLHYELRETATKRLLNPVREGIIRPVDTVPPRIVRIHYVEADTVDGICLRSAPQSYAVEPIAPGRYRLRQPGPLPAGRKGYFVAEVTDRRNGVTNTFGVWRLTAFADGSPFFEYRMDGFDPEHLPYSDALSCYPLQTASRNEVIRLAQLTACPESLYTHIEGRGIVRTNQGQTRRIRLEAEDDMGNTSQLEFDIRGRTGEFRAAPDTAATALYPDRRAIVRLGGELTAEIPEGALHEAIYCHPRRLEAPRPDSGVVLLSPVYRLFDDTVPLHRSVTVTIRTDASPRLQLRAALARVTPKGLAFIGGTYTAGAVCAATRTTGSLIVAADTLPPRIQPLFANNADLTRTTSLRFQARDNFSGIAAWTLRIDGEWVPCDRFPMKGTLTHTFDKPPENRVHEAELSVSDACGNTTLWKGIFYR